jgi:hypothetical protein
MSCLHSYCAVGIPAVLVLLLASLLVLHLYFCVSSVIDVFYVPIVSAAVANVLVVSSHAAVAGVPAECCCLL